MGFYKQKLIHVVSQAPLQSPLTPTFEQLPSERYMSSSWGAGDTQLGDPRLYGSSDRYHNDVTSIEYLSYFDIGETSYPASGRAAAGDGFFADTVENNEARGYWPASSYTTSNGLPSAMKRASKLPMQGYTEHDTTNSQPNGGFVSPSLLNAETDPDSPWPIDRTSTGRLGTTSLGRNAEQPSPGQRAVGLQGHDVEMDFGDSKPSKPPTKDRPSKRSNGSANGSSSRAKVRTGSTTSPPGGESLIQLRTASRKAKRTSSSYKPAASPEEERARSSHNQVEKQYRNRLNHQFERLLAILPTPSDDGEGVDGEDAARISDRRLSKVEVLDMARQHIQMLEKEASDLEQQRQELVTSIGRMTESVRTSEANFRPRGT